MCAELDVVEVKVNEDDGYAVLRMTLAQHKAYRAGRFVPRYTFGTSLEVGLDENGDAFEIENGDAFEIHDVTDLDF